MDIMASIYFSDEHEAFREAARRFIVAEVAPHADEWEATRAIPREIFTRMGERGLLGITIPRPTVVPGPTCSSASPSWKNCPDR